MSNENENVKNIKVEKDKELTKKNAEIYKKEKEKFQTVRTFMTPDGEKSKIIETKIYPNGVKKSTFVGLVKGKRVIINRGIENKIKKDLNIA